MPSPIDMARRGLFPSPKIWNKGRTKEIFRESFPSGISMSGTNTTRLSNVNSGSADDSGAGQLNNKCVGDYGISIVVTASGGSFQIDLASPIETKNFDYIVLSGMSSAAVALGLRLGLSGGGFAGGYISISNQVATSRRFRQYRFHLRRHAASSGANLTSSGSLISDILLLDLNAGYPTNTFYVDHILLMKSRVPMTRRGKYWAGDKLQGRKFPDGTQYQQAMDLAPLINPAAQFWGSNPNWLVYQREVDGFADFVPKTTFEAVQYGARKWGFQKGYKSPVAYKTVKDGVASHALPLVGKTYDVPMGYWFGMYDNESTHKVSSIGDYRLLGIGPAAGVAAWGSAGLFQVNREDWGGWPGTYESVPWSVDLGFAILRHYVDGSIPSGSSATFRPSTYSDDLERIRAGIQGYFQGSYTAEDGTSDPKTGEYISNVWGGTCYLAHGIHATNNRQLNADWLDASYGATDFPTS